MRIANAAPTPLASSGVSSPRSVLPRMSYALKTPLIRGDCKGEMDGGFETPVCRHPAWCLTSQSDGQSPSVSVVMPAYQLGSVIAANIERVASVLSS